MEIDIENIKPPNHIQPALLSAYTKPSIHTVDMMPDGLFSSRWDHGNTRSDYICTVIMRVRCRPYAWM